MSGKAFILYKHYRLMPRLLYSMFVIIFLASCNGESVTTKNIDNRSDRELKFAIYRFGYQQGDTIVVPAGTKKRIGMITSDQASEDAPSCASNIDSAQVVVSGGGSLSRNIAKDQNWTTESEQTSAIPLKYNHECNFVVLQSHILP
jgi:hypothetical protein